jgi:hypothetical protein
VLLHLALKHPGDFRAVVALEGADRVERYYELDWLHRPDIHGGEMCATFVSGQVARQSPDEYRQETLWMYTQSGPGVFKGGSALLLVRRPLRRPLAEDRHRALPCLSPVGRVRFLLRGGAQGSDRVAHQGVEGHGDDRHRALPEVGEPGVVPHLRPAGPRRDPANDPVGPASRDRAL